MALIPTHSRTFRDSGEITFYNDVAIAPGEIFVFNLDERWKPYNQSAILNNSCVNIGVDFNWKGDFKELVPLGNQRVFSRTFEDIRFKNTGTATINVGEVLLTARNDAWKGKKIKDNVNMGASLLGNLSLVGRIIR